MPHSLLPVYNRLNASFVRGEGAWLYDGSGRRYLDFGTGVAVTALGHCHPRLVEALKQQTEKLWHCSNWYAVPQQEQAAATLAAHSFADYVFFGNSGAEAIECAIKMVRGYHQANKTGRSEILTASGAFHGRTFAALAAAGKTDFAPCLPGFCHVAYGDSAALQEAITPQTAAILIEPVLGEGGIMPAKLEYLQDVRALCDENGLLMVLDEIQTGIGRTGRLFAHEWAGVTPDILASAKGLGGGFPVGACIATREAASGMTAGSHGSTFGGNPLAMAVVSAVLEVVLEPGFLPQVDRTARSLWTSCVQLCQHFPDVFTAVRGAGLMLGLVCAGNNREVTEALLERGLLVIPAGGNVIRLLPPLIIDQEHVNEAIRILRSVASDS